MADGMPARAIRTARADGLPARAGRRDPAAGPDRPTIGLVTANIHLGVGATLWSGVLTAAERNDVNVVCFPGGSFRPASQPRNMLYDLISPSRLDGVICWTSSTLRRPAADDEATERFVRRLGALPVISLNRALAGHETLHLDSYAGMREVVVHLVRDHGYRRLACLRGPLANPVLRDRFRAFSDALALHRIPLDRSLVAACDDFGDGAGAAAMRVLVDIRGLRPGRDFDAVVVCSDVLAVDALRFLAGRGIAVPEDVAVVGVNDSLDARLADPPLTSVALPFADLGELAVDTLLARLRSTPPPTRTVVSGTLVTRRSCGCPSPLVTQGAVAPAPGRAAAGAGADAFPHAGGELAVALAADLDEQTPPEHRDGPSPGGAFLPLLERVISSRVRTATDAVAWDQALLAVRAELADARPEAAVRVVAERLLGQARLIVADKSHRLLEYERWAEEQEARRLRDLGTALTTVVDAEGLTAALAGHLPGAGVAGCHVALYADGPRPVPGDEPGMVRLATADGFAPAGTVETVPAGAREALDVAGATGLSCSAPYPAAELLPDALLPRDRRYTLICEPLHIGDEQLGFAVFDCGARAGSARRGTLYRALGDQISAALKGILLFDEVRRARDAAQQADRLKTRLLDNATDELRTPVEAILRHAAATDDGVDDGPTRHAGPEPTGSPGTAPAAAVPYGPDGAAPGLTAAALQLVRQDAGRLLRLIDDLLDLSRSEIDALDLSRRLLDPGPLLTAAFDTVARAGGVDGGAAGDRSAVRLPQPLPAVRADPFRLRQIVVNLLTAVAARTSGTQGRLRLTAETCPTLVRIRVTSPGWSVSTGEEEYLFQPFASYEPGTRLSLAIARRLAVLHGGSVTLDRDADGRCSLRLDLPLPTPAELPVSAGHLTSPGVTPEAPGHQHSLWAPTGPGPAGRHTLVVAAAGPPPPELAALAHTHDLRLHLLRADDTVATLITDGPPVAVAWDAPGGPQEWSAVQRLHDHPALRHTPFLLYGPVAGEDLGQALRALRPAGLADPVVVVDGDACSRERLRRLLADAGPGLVVRTAADGASARSLLAENVPRLLVVARRLPDMDGFEVTERMCEAAGQADIPILMTGDQGFTLADARRAEPYPGMLLLGRDILTDAETARLLAALTGHGEQPGSGPGSAHRTTCAPVRHAVAYLEQHYQQQFSRRHVARSAGVSGDHLSRLFHKELGLTLWEYLTRLRVQRAKEHLRHSGDSMQAVARSVGFRDRAYFSRVFRKVTGVAPHVYREAS